MTSNLSLTWAAYCEKYAQIWMKISFKLHKWNPVSPSYYCTTCYIGLISTFILINLFPQFKNEGATIHLYFLAILPLLNCWQWQVCVYFISVFLKHQRGQKRAWPDRNPYRCRCRQVDSQTCCLCFCFSAWLEEFGGPPQECGGTDGSRTGNRGRRHRCARLRASVRKMESSSWWTARSWDYRLCRPTSALSPLTCE